MKRATDRLQRSLCIALLGLIGMVACSPSRSLEAPSQTDTPATETLSPTLAETPAIDNELDALAARVADLSLEAFFEETFRTITLRDPEAVIELGLETFYDVQDLPLTDISDAYQRETFAIYELILERLHTYDLDNLTSEDQISYRIYEWYLEELLSRREWMYYDYPITHFNTGIQNWIVFFFTDIHPLTNRQDAENYLARLKQVDEKIDQLLEGLALREQAGVLIPKSILQMSIGSIRSIAESPPQTTPFYWAFANKITSIPEMTSEEKAQMLTAIEEELLQNTLPAYQILLNEVQRLMEIAPTEEGVWQHPDGRAYYRYCLHHHTTLDLPAEEIHQLGLNDVDRIQREIRSTVSDLGYPTEVSMPALFSQILTEGGVIPENQIVLTYQSILNDAEARLSDLVDLQPNMDVVVIGTNRGGFYVPGALDGSRPGAFYATVSSHGEPWYGMPTLTYHETVPGHHLQIALTLEGDLPSFRKGASFTAFAEGWALYAERLASESGWYQDDPYGDLGRLQMELFRAARLVVDTGIHAFGWTYDEALQYMLKTTGMERGFLEFEVARYIAWPGQATAYKIGMQAILDLRQKAQEELGEDFNLRGFHNFLLSNGSLPLPILEDIVMGSIQDALSNP